EIDFAKLAASLPTAEFKDRLSEPEIEPVPSAGKGSRKASKAAKKRRKAKRSPLPARVIRRIAHINLRSPKTLGVMGVVVLCLLFFAASGLRMSAAKHSLERARADIEHARGAALRRDSGTAKADLAQASKELAHAGEQARGFPMNAVKPI